MTPVLKAEFGFSLIRLVWTAAFPGLARDLPEVQESENLLAQGQTT